MTKYLSPQSSCSSRQLEPSRQEGSPWICGDSCKGFVWWSCLLCWECGGCLLGLCQPKEERPKRHLAQPLSWAPATSHGTPPGTSDSLPWRRGLIRNAFPAWGGDPGTVAYTPAEWTWVPVLKVLNSSQKPSLQCSWPEVILLHLWVPSGHNFRSPPEEGDV